MFRTDSKSFSLSCNSSLETFQNVHVEMSLHVHRGKQKHRTRHTIFCLFTLDFVWYFSTLSLSSGWSLCSAAIPEVNRVGRSLLVCELCSLLHKCHGKVSKYLILLR